MDINRENFEHFITHMCDCNTCLFNGENECSEDVAQASPECLKRLKCYITGVPYEAPERLYKVNVEITGYTYVCVKANSIEEAKRKALENVENENVPEWYYDPYFIETFDNEV